MGSICHCPAETETQTVCSVLGGKQNKQQLHARSFKTKHLKKMNGIIFTKCKKSKFKQTMALRLRRVLKCILSHRKLSIVFCSRTYSCWAQCSTPRPNLSTDVRPWILLLHLSKEPGLSSYNHHTSVALLMFSDLAPTCPQPHITQVLVYMHVHTHTHTHTHSMKSSLSFLNLLLRSLTLQDPAGIP